MSDICTRTYEIVTSEGRMRMSIPETWKVTYGPINPAGKSYGTDNALRVYEDAGKEKQRAIFTNVISFRDLSIPVQRLRHPREGQGRVAGGRGRPEAHLVRQVRDEVG